MKSTAWVFLGCSALIGAEAGGSDRGPSFLGGRGNGRSTYVVSHSTEFNAGEAFLSLANFHTFTTSGQNSGATYARLVSTPKHRTMDWVSKAGVPSKFFSNDAHAEHYPPFNKPDVYSKWMNSSAAPTEDVVVILDPDSILLLDLAPMVSQVSPGHGVATHAFFYGSPDLKEAYRQMHKERGTQPRDVFLDAVAVPYLVHRSDMARLAPLWKEYTINLMNGDYNRYGSLQPGWCKEMHAFVFAAADLGIRFQLERSLQRRDVDNIAKPGETVYSIHTGRAWFPSSYTPGLRWKASSFMPSFTWRGYEVWCKCNDTGREVIPWPLPEGIDFQSEKTLTAFHEAFERFGHVPAEAFDQDYSEEM